MENVGQYEYDRKGLIGHGAFALVYKGRHKKTKTPVAIKCINKKNLGRSSTLLTKEIKILKELHHENIVQLYECEESAQSYFLVMEFCNGGDLADYLQKKGTLREDTIRQFFGQIANAMKAMHGQGILHRDLKPQNLLLAHKIPNPKPPDIVMKIADFGFARHLQSNMMAATLCGSPMYMAPEVIMSKEYNAKADLWSIGTIIYQCLVGSSPFHANTPQELRHFYEQTRRVQPKIPHGTSPCLSDLLLKLLKRNVVERINFSDFFNHEFFIVRSKTSPVPVPIRANDSFTTPNSSNTSDPRSVIDDFPHAGVECSPSEGEPLFLRSSSSSDSEDFVIVSHPFSSNDSLSAMHSDGSKESDMQKTVKSASHGKHGAAQPKRHLQDSPASEEDAEIARAHSRQFEARSPFMQRTMEGAGSPITVRYSAVSARRRAGSGGSDSDASSHSRPSPVPIPVPTQVENFGKFERNSIRTSKQSFEEKTKHLRSRPRSMSPLCTDSSNQKRGSPQSAGLVVGSLPTLQKALKMFGTPPDFPTIAENPNDPSAPDLRFEHGFKCIFDNKKETLVSRMARAWTAPDLAKLNQRYDMIRSKSSAGLLKQEMVALAEDKILETTQSVGQTSKPSVQNNSHSYDGKNESVVPVGRKFSDSIFELSSSDNDESREFFFYCRFADSICEVAEEHTMFFCDGISDLIRSSQTEDPLQHLTQKQKECEQLLLFLRSLQIVATALHTLRNKVQAGTLPVTGSIKTVARELNDRYKKFCRKKFCRRCEDAKEQCNLSETRRISFVSADKILYFKAVNDCRTAALDEMFEGNLRTCAERYKRALILLDGLSLSVNDDLDRNRLSKYKRGIRYRLQHLEKMLA